MFSVMYMIWGDSVTLSFVLIICKKLLLIIPVQSSFMEIKIDGKRQRGKAS